MAAILKGQARLWFPGQVKPQGVPRIDWTHPLAAGLAFYGFDTGQGVIVDLVAGRLSNPVPGATLAKTGAQNFGTGLTWNASDGRFFNADAAIQNATAAANYTFACQFFSTQAAAAGSSAAIFGNSTGNGTGAQFNWSILQTASTTNIQAQVNSGGVGTIIGGSAATASANTLYSLAGVVTGSNAAFYINAASVKTSTGLTVQDATANNVLVFSAAGNDAVRRPLNTGCMTPYGAFWSRALSQAELLLLHTDPYCFLLPPEGEMPALRQASNGLTATLNETTTATDTETEAMVATASDNEVITATDGLLPSLSSTETTNETLAATDAYSSALTTSTSVNEAVSATDTLTASETASASINEVVVAVDTLSATNSGGTISATLSETTTATDGQSASLVASAADNESAPALDALSTQTGLSLHEVTTATDGLLPATLGVVAEALQATDTASATMRSALSIAEVVVAVDTAIGSVLSATLAIHETTTATDAYTPAFAPTVNERAPAADTIGYQTSPFSASMNEIAPAVDGLRFTLVKFGTVQFNMITTKVGIPRGYAQIPQTGV